MFPQKLYSDLQLNPRSVATYRELAKFYEKCKKTNEANAILELIKKKFDDYSSNINSEQ